MTVFQELVKSLRYIYGVLVLYKHWLTQGKRKYIGSLLAGDRINGKAGNWFRKDAEEQGRIRGHYRSSGFRIVMFTVFAGFAATCPGNSGILFPNYWSFRFISLTTVGKYQ